MDYLFLNRYLSGRTVFMWTIETVLVFFTIIFATAIRFGFSYSTVMQYDPTFMRTLIMGLTYLVTYHVFNLYEPHLYTPKPQMIIKLFQATIVGSIALFILYYILPSIKTWRGVLLSVTVMLPPFLILWRFVFWKWLSLGMPEQRVIVIGSEELAKKVGMALYNQRDLGLKLVGFIDDDPAKFGKSIINPGVIGSSFDIPRLVGSEKIDRIIVASADRRERLPMAELLECKLNGVTVEEGETFLERMTGKVLLHQLKPSWIVFSDGFKSLKSRKIFKRFFDVLFSALGFIAFLPLLLITAILIKLESKGPVIFKQTRVGEHRKEFEIYKFRSMKQDAEASSGPVWAGASDSRVTRVGAFIRKTRIDELPQLVNVIKGEMSFVGPRPERPFFVEQLEKEIPYYDTRLVVKPGITGWAQVNYPYGSTVEDALEKLQYDLYYIKNLNPILDLMIILLTIKVVLTGKGAR